MNELGLLPGFEPTSAEAVSIMSLGDRIKRACDLLKKHEPEEGYYLAFSGGKDSCVIKELAILAGVKFETWYNNTTIDPPELVRFIKKEHPDALWNNPKQSMMHRVVSKSAAPPTRRIRWCCDEYKERGGQGRVKVIGVRQAESKARAKRWFEVATDSYKNPAICPIVYWSDEQVWEFLKVTNTPYCSLYDEGWKRLGCVGCPLNPKAQAREFERWPRYKENWRRAIIKNWEAYRDQPRKDGKQRFQARFKSGEDFWQWWLTAKAPDYIRGDCQSGMLWTNEDLEDL